MQEIFSSKERSTRLDRGDKRLMWALTLIYTVFTLLNLVSDERVDSAERGGSTHRSRCGI